MLNPHNDRLNYSMLLSPPDTYKPDFAVGTSYSLDLDALTGVCLSLGLSDEPDSKTAKNPIALLEALRITGDKIALFCETGNIFLPKKITTLYTLLEQTVYEVKTSPKKSISGYPAFHPKFWLIRYINETDSPLYRIIVLSRNLTFDRSWDISFCMDGRQQNVKTDKNQPVIDFIEYLLRFLPNEYAPKKRAKIRSMLRELPYIRFDTESKEFYDFDFLPVGIPNYNINRKEFDSLFSDSFHELLVMSPFLSDSVIRDFNNRNKYIEHSEYALITRASSLSKIKPESCSNFKIYTIKDEIIDGESAVSEEDNTDIQKQDIHAKLYMVRKNSDTDLYLGSLNASHNAVSGNVEFMIKLRSKNRYLNLAKLSDSLFGKDKDNPDNPFRQINIETIQNNISDNSNNNLDNIIKTVVRLNAHAEVTGDADNYTITVFYDKITDGHSVLLTPLFSNTPKPLGKTIRFDNLKSVQLSKFFKITVSDEESSLSRIIIIPVSGIPEDRDKAVVSEVIKDKNCFYQYVSFLLGDKFALNDSGLSAQKNHAEQKLKNTHITAAGLYEKMLQTAVYAPERFKEIEYLLNSVEQNRVVPEKFTETFNIFRKAAGLHD